MVTFYHLIWIFAAVYPCSSTVIKAYAGEDVVLNCTIPNKTVCNECSLIWSMRMNDIVEWHRDKLWVSKDYDGRRNIHLEWLKNMNCLLKLINVTVNDTGNYTIRLFAGKQKLHEITEELKVNEPPDSQRRENQPSTSKMECNTYIWTGIVGIVIGIVITIVIGRVIGVKWKNGKICPCLSTRKNNDPNTSSNQNPDTSPSGAANTSLSQNPDTSPSRAANASPSQDPDTSPSGATNASSSQNPDTSPSGAANTSPSQNPDASPEEATNTSPSQNPDTSTSGATNASSSQDPDTSPEEATNTSQSQDPDTLSNTPRYPNPDDQENCPLLNTPEAHGSVRLNKDAAKYTAVKTITPK